LAGVNACWDGGSQDREHGRGDCGHSGEL